MGARSERREEERSSSKASKQAEQRRATQLNNKQTTADTHRHKRERQRENCLHHAGQGRDAASMDLRANIAGEQLLRPQNAYGLICCSVRSTSPISNRTMKCRESEKNCDSAMYVEKRVEQVARRERMLSNEMSRCE